MLKWRGEYGQVSMNDKSRSLTTIFRGAALVLMGFLGGGALTLGLQIILARFFQPDIYGVFSQGMSVLYTLVMISLLGLNAGISRQISFKDRDEEAASRAVGSSLAVVVPLSLLTFGALFFNAELVAEHFFSDPRMAEVLKMFAFAGPAMAVNSVFISGFRGHQRSRERVVFLDFVIPFLQIILVGAAILLGYELGGAVAGYASAFILSSAGLFYWYRRNYSLGYSRETLKELVELSWPLMVSAVAVQVFLWSPAIIVGALATSRQAGLINTALPLAASTKMFLSSVAFLYLPVVSELYGKNRLEELSNVHSSATRWITYLALPLLAFFAFNADISLGFVFGEAYTEAGMALTVMAVGYVFTSATGPLGELLIAAGKTRVEMVSNVTKLSIFVLGSFLLVPDHGFLGAAAAYSMGLAFGDLLRLWFARNEAGFFYTVDYLKPVIAVAASLGATNLLSLSFLPALISWGMIYTVSLAALRPLTEEDREIISEPLEKKGLDRSGLNKLLDLLTAGPR